MKKITLIITLFLFAIGLEIQAQCIGTFEYVTVSSNNFGNVQGMDDCNYSGDWNNITDLLIGSDYEFTSSISTDYLTFTDDSNNVIASGTSPLSVPAITVTSGRIHVYYNSSCMGDTTCRATTIQCTSCTPPPAPDCATTPYPEDGAIDVPNGNVTFTWVAPTTGPTPTSYNMYAGETPTGDDYGLIGNFTTTDALITLTGYDVQLYWKIVPVNGATEATGCPVWSFTTESAPPPPANDDCANAESINQEVDIISADLATPIAGTIEAATDSGLAAEVCNSYTGTANDDVWYSFVALTTNVNITFEINGTSLFDGVAQLYSGSCGALVNVGCADDSVTTAPVVEEIQATGLTVNDTYYVRIYQYGTTSTTNKSFDLKIWSPDALTINDYNLFDGLTYYPNPVNNTLTLNGKNTIQDVTIYNMLGQEVIQTAPNAIDSNIDMSNLVAGTYFVKVTVENATKTIKVIKK